MGNNASKPPGGGGSGPASPHARTHSARYHPRHNSSNNPPFHPHSGDSSHSATLSSISSSAFTPSGNPSFTPQATLSAQNPRSSQRHQRAKSSEHLPVQIARAHDSMGNSHSAEGTRDKEARKRERNQDQQSNPVQVPSSGQQRRNRGPVAQFEPSAPPQNDSYAPKSNLNFPPRLPLPIQEEVFSPGSPLITPEDKPSAAHGENAKSAPHEEVVKSVHEAVVSAVHEEAVGSALHEKDVQGALPRRTSTLSHETTDEDEEDDLEATKGNTVPTLIEWTGHAQQVYITGTFAGWARKYRMHRDPNDPERLTARLDLTPGTHHVKFIVDGEMQISNELPTAVDFTNILMNYIEVSADDIPRHAVNETRPEGLHPPLALPPGVQETDFAPDADNKRSDQSNERLIPFKDVHFGDRIPTYLGDLDRPDDTNRFQRVARHISEIPPPPTLPLFLGKSILNGTTPMKDDSSVLNMPNHTVLNHLATSSMKNEVLATSLTTRYKRKYVTTIAYRPTKDDN